MNAPSGNYDHIEREQPSVGWAVMTGCEGEDFHFVAFFAARDRASDYLGKCKGTDDDFYLLDGDATVVPACLHRDGTMLICNSYEEREVMLAMAKEAGITGDVVARWLTELDS